ncbi:MAG: outer membrane lipoprotein-sorting protein, partial [Proteobacteria bacterium]|nr:outer membrane lipoprotein-sorting protein [Pseudomonadota bacterium]
MNNHNLFKTLFLVSTITLVSAVHADLPSGDEIAKNINARNEGISLSRNMTMQMTDRRGKTRTRKTKTFRKYFGDEKKTVIHYLSPRNVKRTAFLTFDYPEANKDDDQWLYLPAMRKVRRISASDRGDYFLGTDFTYEDIKKESKLSIEDYQRQTIREDSIEGNHVVVMQSTPVSESIAKELGYGKVIQWVDDDIW